MNLRGRIEKLDAAIPLPPEPKPEDRAGDALVDLLFEAIMSALPEFSDEEGDRVFAAMEKAFSEVDWWHYPYGLWRDALRKGYCRFPAEVTPAIMRDIMLAFADPSADTRPGQPRQEKVCNTCGMFLPRDFGACPVCGGEKADRNWPVSSHHTARWMGLDRHLNAPASQSPSRNASDSRHPLPSAP